MATMDVVEAAGRGLPKGYCDVMFLRESLQVLLPDVVCDHPLAVANGNIEDVPLALIVSKSSVLADKSENTLYIFPIDLARYPPAQIRTWVTNTRCREVIVVHSRSREVLRAVGYRGDITLAPIPCINPASLPKKQVMQIASIFRYLDSRERNYDPEWLMPGYHPQVTEEPVVATDPKDDHGGAPTAKTLRFRLGATKRHFLNFVREMFEARPGALNLIQSEPAEDDLEHRYQALNLGISGTIFTVVLDEFSDESCWADLIKAFCVAFRFKKDATLLFFLRGDAREQHARDFDHVLCALHPFSCRLLLVQGALDDKAYETLMACTDIYVDVNRRASLRADLRRFWAVGIPTIGFPVQGESNGDDMLVDFPVRHSNEPGFCDFGQDPRYHTTVRRLDWESLLRALTKAHEQVVSTALIAQVRLDRMPSSTRYLEEQKIAWRQVLQKHWRDEPETVGLLDSSS